jgi:tRNA pseudouridine13 synthase
MLPPGRIKSAPEDFVVNEIPAYLPSGEGEHLYMHFTKRGLTTDEAVRRIADALGVSARDIGVAGLKDKIGVTSQWISVHAMDRSLDDRARALAIDGIQVHDARRHGNKLKTGHLAGNRFDIVVRDVPRDRAEEARAALERIGRDGVPNAFGSQRFGREGDNAERALAWLRGTEPGPKDPRKKRFLWSALQSAVFNELLAMRVADGSWSTPLEGDILKREGGGMFVCTDVQTDQERGARGEVSPTGPILGVKMRAPTGKPAEMERAAAAKILGDGFDLAKTRALGEGTRRALRLVVGEMKATVELTKEGASLRVYFVLPKGAYATTVLGAAIRLENAPDFTARNETEPDDS